jgi:REP element-mobilizing transposase RayT
MNNNRIYAKHKVYNVSYHIVWIPNYGKKYLITSYLMNSKNVYLIKLFE